VNVVNVVQYKDNKSLPIMEHIKYAFEVCSYQIKKSKRYSLRSYNHRCTFYFI